MRPISIFIDNMQYDKDEKFAKMLKERFNSIKSAFNVTMYSDIDDSDGENDEWKEITIEAFNKSDIIIPILTADYISGVVSEMESSFDDIVKDNDKYLFPILLSPAEWGSYNWIVKSQMIPQDSIPLSEYSNNDKDRVINELVKTISNIIIKHNSNSLHNKQEVKKQIINENIIFVSHDHDDADFAELLKLKLEKENLDAWLDNERLKIGQDWREEIDLGIENSIAVIAIMTPDARKSEYVTYEWAFAWGKSKKIFPIMLKQTQLHPRLESLQYLDFTNRVSRPWDELITSIKELIESTTS